MVGAVSWSSYNKHVTCDFTRTKIFTEEIRAPGCPKISKEEEAGHSAWLNGELNIAERIRNPDRFSIRAS